MIRLITSLVAVLTVASLQSKTTLKDTPKLMIGITMDQLRNDYHGLYQYTFWKEKLNQFLGKKTVSEEVTLKLEGLEDIFFDTNLPFETIYPTLEKSSIFGESDNKWISLKNDNKQLSIKSKKQNKLLQQKLFHCRVNNQLIPNHEVENKKIKQGVIQTLIITPINRIQRIRSPNS